MLGVVLWGGRGQLSTTLGVSSRAGHATPSGHGPGWVAFGCKTCGGLMPLAHPACSSPGQWQASQRLELGAKH